MRCEEQCDPTLKIDDEPIMIMRLMRHIDIVEEIKNEMESDCGGVHVAEPSPSEHGVRDPCSERPPIRR